MIEDHFRFLGPPRPYSRPQSRGAREGIRLFHDGCNMTITQRNRAVARNNRSDGTHVENRQ